MPETAGPEERLDAFLYRLSSLATSVQDQVGRTLLLVEEEDLSTASRRDQRLLLERLGAMDEALQFGVVAELRNRLAHSYPDDPEKQVEVLTMVKDRAGDLIAAYNGMLAFASRHRIGIALSGIVIPEASVPGP